MLNLQLMIGSIMLEVMHVIVNAANITIVTVKMFSSYGRFGLHFNSLSKGGSLFGAFGL